MRHMNVSVDLPGHPVKYFSLLLTVMSASASLVVADESPTQFVYPIGVAASDDVTYVADRKLPGVWKVEEGKPTVFFQASRKFGSPLAAIRCVALDHEGNLLAGDSSTRDVYRFDANGKPVSLAGGKIGIPTAIAVRTDGTIFVTDLDLHQVVSMPAKGTPQPKVVAKVPSPRGLTLGPDQSLLVLSTSSKQGQILQVADDGKVTAVVERTFGLPHNIVRWDDNTFYVTDNYKRCVWKVPPDGTPSKWIEGDPLDRPVGLCRAGNKLLVTDPHIKKLFEIDPSSGEIKALNQ